MHLVANGEGEDSWLSTSDNWDPRGSIGVPGVSVSGLSSSRIESDVWDDMAQLTRGSGCWNIALVAAGYCFELNAD